jgi:regulator of protease activity HflC (stomatin/prohibitin superfamily)
VFDARASPHFDVVIKMTNLNKTLIKKDSERQTEQRDKRRDRQEAKQDERSARQDEQAEGTLTETRATAISNKPQTSNLKDEQPHRTSKTSRSAIAPTVDLIGDIQRIPSSSSHLLKAKGKSASNKAVRCGDFSFSTSDT